MDYQKTNNPSKTKQLSYRAKRTKAKQIEGSLIERHTASQANIRAKRWKQATKESDLNSGIPNITKTSRSLMKLELDMMFKDKRLGKEVSASISNLREKVSSEIQNTDLTLDISNWNLTYKAHQKHVSDLSKEIPEIQTKSGLSYESVKKTLISNLKKTKPLAEDTKYTHDTNLSVEERTKEWMLHRDKKVQKLRESSQDTDLKECTFKPQMYRYSLPAKNTNRESNRTVEYSPINPNGKQLNYSTGFNMSSFVKRSKPMVNYKHASIHI